MSTATPRPGSRPIFVLAATAAEVEPLVEALSAGGGAAAYLPLPVAEATSMPFAELAGARFVVVADELPSATAKLAPDRWRQCRPSALHADPRGQLQTLCEFTDVAYDQALLSPLEDAARRRAAQVEAEAEAAAASARAFGSVSTASFSQAIHASGGSLLISTYQTHRLVCARAGADGLNTHFRGFDKPMGLAVAGDRIALGTRTEVWEFRNVPAAAAGLEPPGSHDACFVPRRRHVTGDIAIHDLAYAAGELWLVATAFSCLATLDDTHSFVPRWTPSCITRLVPEDRCHLNGLAVVDDRPAYATALGTTDEAGGWRANKATGGVLFDLATGEIAVRGLSMPHSPRWHNGRLWLLESGRGTLAVADPGTGTVETVAELPGFTRGLCFLGDLAFVGLSQIRESSTFGDLPVTHRLQERQSGVWMVDLRTAQIAGFLRFDDLVQEIFEVAALPGVRWPEVAEPGETAAERTYVLP